MNKPHRSKISRIENDVFEIGSVKHAFQFSKSLKNVANYLQMKYNNNVVEAIWTMGAPDFNYPEMPQPVIKQDKTGKEVEIKPSEGELFMWKRFWDKVND